jgi:alkylhydroperoxidase family enzyme
MSDQQGGLEHSMARVAYGDPDKAPELVAQIRNERTGRLSNLYRLLLNSPAVAAGWLQLGTAIRYQSKLDGPSRELAICLVARLTGAEYEWRSHEPLARAEGVAGEKLASLEEWRESDHFDPRERAILAYAEQMTNNIEVDDSTFSAVRAHFDDQEIVELTATVAFYNLVSRFLVALEVD